MLAFTWTTDDQAGNAATAHTEPMTIAYLFQPDPAAAADAAWADCLSRPPGRRVLHLRGLGEAIAGRPCFNQVPLDSFVMYGHRVIEHRDYMIAFWRRWKSRGPAGGLRPDRIVMDCEGWQCMRGNGTLGKTWEERAAALAPLLNDPIIGKRFPAPLRSRSEDFLKSDWRAESVWGDVWARFEAFAAYELAWALKTTALATWQDVFGTPSPPASNYDDVIVSRENLRDANHWLIPAGNRAVAGISVGGGSYLATPPADSMPARFNGLRKPPRWTSFIMALNTLRACRPPRRPWISHPFYNGDNMPAVSNPSGWLHLVKHLAAMGIGQVEMWCHGISSEEWPIVEAGLANATIVPGEAGTAMSASYSPIPLDAESVRTNGYVTPFIEEEWL